MFVSLCRYEQLDADRHIAQCLQAVMDLEMENDVVLLYLSRLYAHAVMDCLRMRVSFDLRPAIC